MRGAAGQSSRSCAVGCVNFFTVHLFYSCGKIEILKTWCHQYRNTKDKYIDALIDQIGRMYGLVATAWRLTRCRKNAKSAVRIWLEARYDYEQAAPTLESRAYRTASASMWRYEELLPHVVFGVGGHDGRRVDAAAPGGSVGARIGARASLHQRRAPIAPPAVSKIARARWSFPICARTASRSACWPPPGNKAAAYAAFCARAGIRLWIFLTSTVPSEKLRELALYGAEVVKIAGTYDQAKKVASDFAARRNLYLDAGAQNIIGREAFKTVAFEIAEQLARLEPTGRGAGARRIGMSRRSAAALARWACGRALRNCSRWV